MSNEASAAVRSAFNGAAAGFVDLVRQIPDEAWEQPALGVWTVRDLVGHTSRALSTVETYLGKGAPGEPLDGPLAYFLAARAALADPEAVARRGRDAGAALGADPAATVATLAERVIALVAGAADDASVGSPVGQLSLAGYLPTRTFELTVHSLDVARATAHEPPASLEPAITACLALVGRLAAHSPQAPALLLALTGRTALPDGFTVL